jgi:hypothetical protein
MAVVHRRSPLGKREGYVKDLTPAQRREMTSRNRSVAIGRAKRQTKSFIDTHGPLIAVGAIALALLYFRKELKEKIGGQPLQLNP